MGYVYRRKKSLYIAYRDNAGRVIRESVHSTRKTDASALLRRREQQQFDARVAGVPVQSDVTLAQYAKDFLKHVRAHNKPTSVRRDEVALKRLLPFFKGAKLREITSARVQRYIDGRRVSTNKKGKRVSAQTILNEIFTLSAIFREAIREELVQFNPVARVKKPHDDNTIVRYLSEEEDQALYRELPDRIKPIITVALHAGLRKGELFNLEWDDIDYEQGLLRVKNTKSKRKRYIPINQTLRETLKALPKDPEDLHIFVNRRTGTNYKDIKTSWAAALKRAGIKNFRFHDLRHTFASRLIQTGERIETIRDLLGHRDISTTQRYSHLAPGDLRRAVGRLDKLKRARKGKGEEK